MWQKIFIRKTTPEEMGKSVPYILWKRILMKLFMFCKLRLIGTRILKVNGTWI